jgi:hypothetical protein
MKPKEMFTSLVLRLAKAPRVGHLVEVAIATWRGPETRFAVLQKLAQPPGLTPEQRPPVGAVGAEVQNLVVSVPVAMRKLRRELDELKQQVAAQQIELQKLREAQTK